MSAAPKLSFEFKPQPTYILVELSGVLSPDDATTFVDLVTKETEEQSKDVIVQCALVLDLNSAWRRSLMTTHKLLKAKNKGVRLVGANEPIRRLLKQEGLDQSLKNCANVKAALLDLGLIKERSLDVGFVNPFLQATLKVLSTQASTEARAGQIYKKGARDKFLGDISGVIGLVSEAFTGSVVISFPAATFLGVMSRMLGEECKEINKDIEDGAGELTNIIFGQAKTTLNELGYGINTALPSVITGQQHSVLQMSNGPRMVIPFETDLGPFFVEICVSE